MNIFIILIAVLTIIQLLACHFSLWWILAVLARVLFSLRVVGATFKVKKLAILEGVSWACMLVFNMVFSKDNLPWVRLLVFALMSALCVFLMFLDDILYVYVTEDDDD